MSQLETYHALQRAGYTAEQSETLIVHIEQIIDSRVATKADIADLRAVTKMAISDLKTELKTDTAQLKTDFASLEVKLGKLETKLTQWIVGALFLNGTFVLCMNYILRVTGH